MRTAKKLITLPNNLLELVEIKAETLGFGFAEYVRYVLANDVRTITERVEVATPELEKEIGSALKDIENGEFIDVEPEGIESYLNSK